MRASGWLEKIPSHDCGASDYVNFLYLKRTGFGDKQGQCACLNKHIVTKFIAHFLHMDRHFLLQIRIRRANEKKEN
jgi:hypothetical protein